MTLPIQSDLKTLDFTKDGQSWCKVPARSDVDPTTLDLVKNGQPWVVNPYGAAAGVTGALAGTLPNLAGAVAGTHGVTGNEAGTLANLTGAISGTHGVAGTLGGTLPDLAGNMAGKHGVAGTAAGTLANLIAALAAAHGVAGQAAGTLPNLASAMQGAVGAGVTGNLAGVLSNLTGDFQGTVSSVVLGTLSGLLGNLIGSMVATVPAAAVGKWKFPALFGDIGFSYGNYDPGQAAAIAIGCLHLYMKTGDERAGKWARRILDDLRVNRQSPDYPSLYKSDLHYGWLNALVATAFGLAVNGQPGQLYRFPSTADDLSHFQGMVSRFFAMAGDSKPNVLNADLIPFTYVEAVDQWEYAPNYLAAGQMGSLEAVVLMLGAALEYGKLRGDWDWFNRLLAFIFRDNLTVLSPAQLRTVTAACEQTGAANLVRLCYADFDRDGSKYCEARDQDAIDHWGEKALDLDFRYGSPVILEDPATARLLATRLLQRLAAPQETAEVETWLEGARVELGDTVAVSSDFHGWDQEDFTVQGKDLDLGRRRVQLKLSRPLDRRDSWAMDAAGSADDAWAIDQASSWDEYWDSRAYVY